MAETVLACTDLRKTYDQLVAVDDVSFTIESGETYGLLGPNGAGKTTTISMVAGLLEKDGGTAVVAGNEITTKSTAAKAAIGLVPQDLAIYPDLTARENLRFFGKLYAIGDDLNARVDEVRQVGVCVNVDEAGLQDEISRALSSLLAGLLEKDRIGGPAVDTARAVVELAKELRLNVDQANAQLDSM